MQTSVDINLSRPAAETRQFLLKTEFNAHETRMEEHMRDS